MNQREKIDWLGAPVMESIVKMAEGNPGAATVLGQMMGSGNPSWFLAIMKLDDHGIRGHQIWMGYKDICKEDVAVFLERANRETLRLAEEIKALEQ